MSATNKIRLGDVCTFINGGAWKQSEYSESGIPVVQVTNIKNESIDISDLNFLSNDSYDHYKKHALMEDDLVIATVGSHITQESSAAGRAIVVRKFAAGMLLNQNAVAIRSNSEMLDQKYLGLVGKSYKFKAYLGTVGQGAANQVRIALSAIKKYKCELPPNKIQKKIVEVISPYYDLMDRNQRQIQLLEDSARLLFREWFVYFKFPGHEKVKIVGGMPEGWKKEKIDKLVIFKRGVEPGSDNYLDVNESGSFPFFRVSDLVTRNPSIFVDEQYAKKAFIKKNDIVISLDGSVGIVSIGLEGCYSTGIRKLVIKDKKVNRAFLYFLMKSHYLQGVINAYAKGTTIQHAGEAIKHMESILPPQNIMDLFDEIANPILDEILVLFKENQKLVQARDLLLPRLMSSTIEV